MDKQSPLRLLLELMYVLSRSWERCGGSPHAAPARPQPPQPLPLCHEVGDLPQVGRPQDQS